MKTEQISVPHFEGFKCLGYLVPKAGQHICMHGKSPQEVVTDFTDTKFLVYEKLPPKRYIFEETGEYRRAEHGEWFFSATHNPCRWLEVYPTPYKFKILRKVDE